MSESYDCLERGYKLTYGGYRIYHREALGGVGQTIGCVVGKKDGETKFVLSGYDAKYRDLWPKVKIAIDRGIDPFKAVMEVNGG